MRTLGQSVVISGKWSSLLEIVARGSNTTAAPPYALVALFLASASSGVGAIVAQLSLVRRVLRASPWYVCQDTRACALAASLMGLLLVIVRVVFGHESFGLGALLESMALLTTGSVAYALALWLIDCRFVVESARLVWRAARSA